jgi:D-inositol-3-phosphate glycosyltransferase
MNRAPFLHDNGIISRNDSVLDSTVFSNLKQSDMGDSVSELEVALLTGGIDRPYAFGLSLALASKGVKLDVVGSRELDGPEMQTSSNLTFLKMHEDQRQKTGLARKFLQVVMFYTRLLCYAATARPKIFHILWNYKFQLFDRTLLLLYYKVLGKRIVFTAHNVNAAKRDGNESILNRLSLKIQYRLVDHIFVHTDKMKHELLSGFGVGEGAVSVIPFGVNNSVPDTELSPAEAKQRLGINSEEKAILFFGHIRPYKGLDYLVAAFQQIALRGQGYRLIIAGEPKKESIQSWREIQQTIQRERIGDQVIQQIRFISDEETEIFFKAADVLVLPYTEVFQSGVLFLAYNFGLPVIATDVGSLRDDIIEGETGYICRPSDATDLARTIEAYFESDLFRTLNDRRAEIKNFARGRNSWDVVSDKTCNVYAQLIAPGN